jgi:anti-anti-sigma factor
MGSSEVFRTDYLSVERDHSTLTDDGIAAFVVSGELDIGSVDALIAAILPVARRASHLVLDLSGLDFIDCSGIGALIRIVNSLGPDGNLTIRRPSAPVRRVLELTGADRREGLVISS